MELELVWLGGAELKWAESRGGRVSVSELLYFLLPTLHIRVRTFNALHGHISIAPLNWPKKCMIDDVLDYCPSWLPV